MSMQRRLTMMQYNPHPQYCLYYICKYTLYIHLASCTTLYLAIKFHFTGVEVAHYIYFLLSFLSNTHLHWFIILLS
jgi:hypothetical protein